MKKIKKIRKMLYVPILAGTIGLMSVASACGTSTTTKINANQGQEERAFEKLFLESGGNNKEYARELADKVSDIVSLLEQSNESALTRAEFSNFATKENQRIDVKAIVHYHNDFEFDKKWRIVRNYKEIQKAVADDNLKLELTKSSTSRDQLTYYLTIDVSETTTVIVKKIVTIKKFMPVPIWQVIRRYVSHGFITPYSYHSMDEQDASFLEWKNEYYPPTIISPVKNYAEHFEHLKQLGIRDGLYYYPNQQIVEGELGPLGVFALEKHSGDPYFTAIIYYNTGRGESYYYETNFDVGYHNYSQVYNKDRYINDHIFELKTLDYNFDVKDIRKIKKGAYLRISAFGDYFTSFFDYKHYLNSIALDTENNIIGVYSTQEYRSFILWLYFDKESKTIKAYKGSVDRAGLIYHHPPKEAFTEEALVQIIEEE